MGEQALTYISKLGTEHVADVGGLWTGVPACHILLAIRAHSCCCSNRRSSSSSSTVGPHLGCIVALLSLACGNL